MAKIRKQILFKASGGSETEPDADCKEIATDGDKSWYGVEG